MVREWHYEYKSILPTRKKINKSTHDGSELSSSDFSNSTPSYCDSLQGRYVDTLFYARRIYRRWHVVTPGLVSLPYVLMEELRCGGTPWVTQYWAARLSPCWDENRKPSSSLSQRLSHWATRATLSLRFPTVRVKWVPSAIFQAAQMVLLAVSLLLLASLVPGWPWKLWCWAVPPGSGSISAWAGRVSWSSKLERVCRRPLSRGQRFLSAGDQVWCS